MDRFELIKKVIKDYDLPLQPVSSKHVEYALNTFPWIYDYDDAIVCAETWLKETGCSVHEFDNATHRITQNCIDSIQALDSYKQFNEQEFIAEKPICIESIPYYKGLDIYKRNNNSKRFVSIDLSKANLQSFIHGNVIENMTYEDFLKTYGHADDDDLRWYIGGSKHFRQLIFGNLNPKKQQLIEKNLVERILEQLVTKSLISPKDVYGYTTDEIILNWTENVSELESKFYAPIYMTCGKYNIKVHIEDFILKNIEPYDFWVKIDPNTLEPYKLKKVPIVYYLQVLKHIYKMDNDEEDLMFLYEKLPCKFCTRLWKDD